MAWIILLFVPYLFHTDQVTRLEHLDRNFERGLQLIALLSLASCELAGGVGPVYFGLRRMLTHRSGVVLSLTFCVIMAFSVYSIAPAQSFLYALLTIAAFALCAIAWYDNEWYMVTCLGWLGWGICAFMLLLLFMLGWDRHYHTIGGMHHNMCGTAVATAVICLHLGRVRFRWPATALCVAAVVATSSRSALLFLLVFVASIVVLRPWSLRPIMNALVASVILMLGLATLSAAGNHSVSGAADDVFALSDPNRGVHSGMTGRTYLWKNALRNIAREPWIGYGYRTRAQNPNEEEMPKEANGHSAYLNMLLDVGVVGAVPLLLVVMGLTGAHVHWAFKSYGRRQFPTRQIPRPQFATPRDFRWSPRFSRVTAAFLLATLVNWVIEPAYFNLGLPQNTLLFVVMMAPLGGVASNAG